MVVAKDKSEALITYVSVLNRPNHHSRCIKLQGLDDDKIYRIDGDDKTYRGATLKKAGIMMECLWGDYQSKLVHIKEVNK